jgi:hypothetical protein
MRVVASVNAWHSLVSAATPDNVTFRRADLPFETRTNDTAVKDAHGERCKLGMFTWGCANIELGPRGLGPERSVDATSAVCASLGEQAFRAEHQLSVYTHRVPRHKHPKKRMPEISHETDQLFAVTAQSRYDKRQPRPPFRWARS